MNYPNYISHSYRKTMRQFGKYFGYLVLSAEWYYRELSVVYREFGSGVFLSKMI